MTGFDPRTTPVRDGRAAAALEGVTPARRFVEPTPMRVVAPSTAIRGAAGDGAEQVDQLLFGEVFDVLDHQGDVVWGQARRDGYVGFVGIAALSGELRQPTHRVAALRTFAFETASIKSPARGPLSLNALVSVDEEDGSLVRARDIGWIAKSHLRPIGDVCDDPAAVAELFLGAPYLWGGRDSLGTDCSGLIQQALYACGRACPRDSDQQAALGLAAPPLALRRGDLVFWKGHVGMMLDARRLLHANAHHMAVAIEHLVEAEARIRAVGNGAPIAFRRLQGSPFSTR